MIQKGDIIGFRYVPRYLENLPPQGYLAGRGRVIRVRRQDDVAIVKVWNGKIEFPITEQYDEIRVPLAEAHLLRKKRKGE